MNANEFLIYLIEREIDSLFRAARALPADKLAWQPGPATRSALCQLQEVATASEQFWSIYETKTMEWSDEAFAKWKEERSKITDLDELEKLTRANLGKVVEYIRGLDPSEYTVPVSLPFGNDFKMADVLAYPYWNMSYHEGQINYIASLLES